jgi:Tol biopolymer transport system component
MAGTLASAGDPVWSPDGRGVIVFGRRATSGEGTDPDWWWAPLDGGPVAQTGVYERLRARHLEINDADVYPYPLAWVRDGVLFSAVDAGTGDSGGTDSRSIWSIAIDLQTGRATGDPVRLTTGTTMDTHAAVSRSGRMVFAATERRELLFALSLDANTGRPTGPLRRIREDTAETGRATASENGRLLAFPRYEFGSGGVWLRDLNTGRERQLAATPRAPLNPIISTDGRWVAYTITTENRGGDAGPGAGYVVEAAGGAPRQVCDECQIYQWSRDNTQVFAVDQREGLVRLDLATGSRMPVVAPATRPSRVDASGLAVDRPLLAPNGRWLAFIYGRTVFTAPLHTDRATPESEWVRIHAGAGAERSAGLSPDGRLLYLLFERDGFRCLYAQRLDSDTGRPFDEPFLVQHFHDASRFWGSTGFGSATVTGMFIADLVQASGNVWMTTIASR